MGNLVHSLIQQIIKFLLCTRIISNLCQWTKQTKIKTFMKLTFYMGGTDDMGIVFQLKGRALFQHMPGMLEKQQGRQCAWSTVRKGTMGKMGKKEKRTSTWQHLDISSEWNVGPLWRQAVNGLDSHCLITDNTAENKLVHIPLCIYKHISGIIPRFRIKGKKKVYDFVNLTDISKNAC